MNGPFENNLVAYSGLADQFPGRDLAGNADLAAELFIEYLLFDKQRGRFVLVGSHSPGRLR